MKLSKSQKIIVSSFFLILSTYQCVDNIEEERRVKSRKGKTHKSSRRVRSRKGKEFDLPYEPFKEED